MGKYRSLGTWFDRIFRNDLNANFDDVDRDIRATQQQVNKLVVKGDSSPQAVQASINANGIDFDGHLKARLDADYNEVTTQLATKVDRVLLDGSTMNFISGIETLFSIDVSVAGNQSYVQTYIDTLVENGQISGVSLADGIVTIDNEALIIDRVINRDDYGRPVSITEIDEHGKTRTTTINRDSSGKVTGTILTGGNRTVTESIIRLNGKVISTNIVIS